MADAADAAKKVGGGITKVAGEIFGPSHILRNTGIVVGLALVGTILTPAAAVAATGGTAAAAGSGITASSAASAAGHAVSSTLGAAWDGGGKLLHLGHDIVTGANWSGVGDNLLPNGLFPPTVGG